MKTFKQYIAEQQTVYPSNYRVTEYYPGKGGIEGKDIGFRSNPLTTVRQHLSSKNPSKLRPVSLASDPKRGEERYRSGEVGTLTLYNTNTGEQRELPTRYDDIGPALSPKSQRRITRNPNAPEATDVAMYRKDENPTSNWKIKSIRGGGWNVPDNDPRGQIPTRKPSNLRLDQSTVANIRAAKRDGLTPVRTINPNQNSRPTGYTIKGVTSNPQPDKSAKTVPLPTRPTRPVPSTSSIPPTPIRRPNDQTSNTPPLPTRPTSSTATKTTSTRPTTSPVSRTQPTRKVQRREAARNRDLTASSPKAPSLAKQVFDNQAMNEEAPPGMEEWIMDRKEDFKKRYGDRWEEVLYATAWKRHNRKK